jgi:hypothetical protein
MVLFSWVEKYRIRSELSLNSSRQVSILKLRKDIGPVGGE